MPYKQDFQNLFYIFLLFKNLHQIIHFHSHNNKIHV
jgi:hypothetical protein